MEITSEFYKIDKVVTMLKKNKLFFICVGVHKNPSLTNLSNKNLINLNIKIHRVFIITLKETFKNSILKRCKPFVYCATFFIQLKEKLNSFITIKNFLLILKTELFFTFALKLNNKIYSVDNVLKTLNLLNYKGNKLIYYQFFLTQTKTFFISK